jgi:hypothetical protein
LFKRKTTSRGPVLATGAAYGLTVTLEAPDTQTLERMRAALPPTWEEGAAGTTELRFSLTSEDRTKYRINLNEGPLSELVLDDALEILPGMVRQYIAGSAPEVVFVHSGAVAFNGRGILIPGESFSGKSTLVTALVLAGAEYYSDEYAVITPEGRLIPYAKDLSLRLTSGDSRQTSRRVDEIGGTVGTTPVHVGLLVLTEYRASALWDPIELSVADGVVAVLGHAEPVQDRPAETVSAIKLALEQARVLKSRRGDASETAAALLAMLA